MLTGASPTALNGPRHRLGPPPGLAQQSSSHPTWSTSPLTPTIFHAEWWLDAVTGGTWQEAQVQSGGKLVGRFPYVSERRFGQNAIALPLLTHFLGPAVDAGPGGPSTRLLRRLSITRDLVAALPNHALCWIKCHREVSDTLVFQSYGYRTDVQFTCEVAPGPQAVLWAGLRDTTRRVIRRAGDRFQVVEPVDPEQYLSFYTANLAARGKRNSYPKQACIKVIEACRSKNAGRLLAATDEKGEWQASIFTIWDDVSEYYLMSSRRRDADNGAIGLLIWTSMLHAASRDLAFDLDGISNGGDLQFLTRFGGHIQPRYIIHRSSLRQRMAGQLASAWHGLASRRNIAGILRQNQELSRERQQS